MGNEWTKLTLTTGLNPGGKDPYVMAYHKGSYVKVARIVPRTYINRTYVSNIAALNALLNNKGNIATNNHDFKKFKTQIIVKIASNIYNVDVGGHFYSIDINSP